jgi:hypothetical protein
MSEVIPAGQAAEAAAFLDKPPPFFSAAFHLHFLPRAIVYRLDDYRQRQRQGGFSQHVQLEIPIVIFLCVGLAVAGIPALARGSLGGWIMTLLGVGGFVALVAWAVLGETRWRREQRHRYGYNEFMPSVFFFCVLAGGSAGLIAGGILGDDPKLGGLWALPGLVLGYLAGPFAARWVHALGFMKTWFIYLAILGLILLPLEDLLVLVIYGSKP